MTVKEKVSSSLEEFAEWMPFPLPQAFIVIGMVFLTLTSAMGIVGYWFLERDFNIPANTQDQKTTLLKVKPGMGLGQVAHRLAEKGLIRHPFLFRFQARLRGGASRIRVGAYEFSPSMRPRFIYYSLIDGKVAERSVTIPEGFNLKEIATAIQKSGLSTRQEVLAVARDQAFISKFQLPTKSLEGYLFPDTYRFPLGITAQGILTTMLETLRKKLSPPLLKQISEQDMSVHQVLTLASIIEKETSLDAERPLIAAVFLNRLQKKMRLQSDPTVIYGLPAFDGNIRRRDLSYNSPYNTYRYKGLPPGPIASPGLASIRAVLNPADVDYLYFVATRKGGHKFSRTYKEHQKAVARFQLRKETVDR